MWLTCAGRCARWKVTGDSNFGSCARKQSTFFRLLFCSSDCLCLPASSLFVLSSPSVYFSASSCPSVFSICSHASVSLFVVCFSLSVVLVLFLCLRLSTFRVCLSLSDYIILFLLPCLHLSTSCLLLSFRLFFLLLLSCFRLSTCLLSVRLFFFSLLTESSLCACPPAVFLPPLFSIYLSLSNCVFLSFRLSQVTEAPTIYFSSASFCSSLCLSGCLYLPL